MEKRKCPLPAPNRTPKHAPRTGPNSSISSLNIVTRYPDLGARNLEVQHQPSLLPQPNISSELPGLRELYL